MYDGRYCTVPSNNIKVHTGEFVMLSNGDVVCVLGLKPKPKPNNTNRHPVRIQKAKDGLPYHDTDYWV